MYKNNNKSIPNQTNFGYISLFNEVDYVHCAISKKWLSHIE